MTLQMITENDRGALANRLAHFVAEELKDAIKKRGKASLAVAGGSTPKAFLTKLGETELDWSKVIVILTDERCVSASNTRSNAKFLSETLLTGVASKATFIPIFHKGMELRDNLDSLASLLSEQVMPIDLCVLGMGTDMHTASLFPQAKGLEDALDPGCTLPIVPIHPSTGEERRLSMTANTLTGARQLHLLITGEAKRAALERAQKTKDIHLAPIKVALDANTMHTIWYAP